MGVPGLHELPASISELSHLQELSIIGVQIFSMFPEQLLHLQDLRVLHLEGPFSYGGSLPLDWSGVPRLRKLRLLDMSNLFGAFVSRIGTPGCICATYLSCCTQRPRSKGTVAA